MLEIYDMPGHLIRRVSQISSALFAEECGAFDITSVQFAAMMAIQAHPDIDATRLSSLVAFDRSTLGDVLERLEGKRWLARSPSPTDKRIKLTRLTPEGESALASVKPAVRRVQERLLAPLPAKDRATMMRLLSQLAHLHSDMGS